VFISELQAVGECAAATRNMTVCAEQLNAYAADVDFLHPIFYVPCA